MPLAPRIPRRATVAHRGFHGEIELSPRIPQLRLGLPVKLHGGVWLKDLIQVDVLKRLSTK
jgi:hypothetical protein